MKTKSFFANFLMMATLVACNSTTPKQDSTVEKTDSAKETATVFTLFFWSFQGFDPLTIELIIK
ncbi:MAG: hypothetical protein KBT32_01775 [Bacteroidales bacterium]|nr:hypothetical protein [Candidatus Physcocola equi]